MSQNKVFAAIKTAAVIFLLAAAAGSVFDTSTGVGTARASTAIQGAISQYPLGVQVLNNPTVSTGLTIPAGTLHAMISVRTAGTMMRDDGVAVTSTTGFYVPAGTVLLVNNDPKWLAAMRFACSTDGACVVYATYYRNRKPSE
jgi:hypothetical protein